MQTHLGCSDNNRASSGTKAGGRNGGCFIFMILLRLYQNEYSKIQMTRLKKQSQKTLPLEAAGSLFLGRARNPEPDPRTREVAQIGHPRV